MILLNPDLQRTTLKLKYLTQMYSPEIILHYFLKINNILMIIENDRFELNTILSLKTHWPD
tara:strand:+ start:229 stop:411 length:183 start_codon:yes stop_codon:yes gene_type:complete